MKTASPYQKASVFSLGLLFSAALASNALAGPGPQYWIQRENTRAGNAAKVQTTGSAVKTGMACRACKTVTLVDAVYTRRESAEIDNYGYEWVKVGDKHTCKKCGGAITVIHGNTTNDMKLTGPVCVKAAPSCCAVSSLNNAPHSGAD